MVATKKMVHGESHPDTHNSLAAYTKQGKYREAEVLLRQCLAKQVAALGENHSYYG